MAKRKYRTNTKVNAAVWRELRRKHLAIYPECRICGTIHKSNHVHHMIYRGSKETKGMYERPGDLVTFCAEHHNGFHEKYGTDPAFSGNFIKGTLEYVNSERQRLGEPPIQKPSKAVNGMNDSDRKALKEFIGESIKEAMADV